ncbi:hypothetical protein OG984_04455 [Nocardioides sp. NBC_00368]|uniref:hypothetical protein n=1 Tax=Nocardioides sp. NBC_00368 TaxID=2976000 RepID=UPI002E208B99
MSLRGAAVAFALVSLSLAGCGSTAASSGGKEPFALPVGPSAWDATAPAWYADGTLHVGERSVDLGDRVDQFVLGATGVYWTHGQTLWFTSAEGETEKVEKVGWSNLAVSADRSVFATVDQSRGPTDEFGTHVLQVAAFDTRTGEQLYRTPDQEPDGDADLADLYSEVMPLLIGVSDERLFFAGTTIDLDDGSTTEASRGPDGEIYEGYAETLFPDGFHVYLDGEGQSRKVADTWLSGVGLLSPDRSTIFDTTEWPTKAVAYDASTGDRRAIDAPWDHFTLAGWSDEATFFGVAQRIDTKADDVLRAQQVVTCELRTLVCTPVSPVIPTDDEAQGDHPTFLVEGNSNGL